MRDSMRGETGAGFARLRRTLRRLIEPGEEAGLRYLALQDSARVGRVFALATVAAIAAAGGWGNRALFGAILVGAAVAALAFSTIGREMPRSQRRLAAVMPAAWTLCLVALAVAGRDPVSGTYEAAPLLVAAIGAAGSFGGSLSPGRALAWLGVSTPLVWFVSVAMGSSGADAALTPVGMLAAGTIGMAAGLARREAELDRHDLTELARRIDATASVATASVQITDSIGGWGIFDAVLLVAFESRHAAIVLAKFVGDADIVPFEPGEGLPAGRVTYLRECAERGPWIERARAESVAEGGRQVRAGIDHAVAYVPIVGEDGPAALLIAACRASGAQSAVARLADELPVLVDAAVMAAGALVPLLARRAAEVQQREWLAMVIAHHEFSPVFQPVLDLSTGQAVGFEALTRFSDGTPPDRAFAHAERLGLGLWLEEATLAAAVEASVDLPDGAWLSLNLSPAFLLSRRPVPILARVRRDVVLELTEHVAIDDYGALRAAVAEMGPSVKLAVDDAGAGFASLRHVVQLEPHIVKLDLSLVRGVDADGARRALLSSLCHFAAQTNCRLLAEGIETEAELETIRSLGIELGQGFLLGRPSRLERLDRRSAGDTGSLADAA